jgi:glycosyltransferase 2 family protein
MTEVAPTAEPVLSAPATPLAWRRWGRQVGLVLLAALALYVGLILWAGWGRASDVLRAFPAESLGWVVGWVVVGWLLRGVRWLYFSRRLGWNVPAGPNLLVFLASFAFTATPGKAGEVVKSVLLQRRYGVPVAPSAAALVVERLQDLIAVLLLAAGGLTLLADATLYFAGCAVIVAGVAAFLLSERLQRLLLGRLERVAKLRPVAAKLADLFATGRGLLRPAPFAVGLGFALLGWACEGLALQEIFRGLGVDLPWRTTFFVYGLSTVVGALSLLPGGVGGFEGCMLLLLRALNVAEGTSAAAVVLVRVATLWLISLLGFAFLGVWFAVAPRSRGAKTTEA